MLEHGATVVENDDVGLAGSRAQAAADHLAIQCHLLPGARGGPATDGGGEEAAAEVGAVEASVSTMQLATTSVSPDASRARIASRSSLGVLPSRCSARTPALRNWSRMWTL